MDGFSVFRFFVCRSAKACCRGEIRVTSECEVGSLKRRKNRTRKKQVLERVKECKEKVASGKTVEKGLTEEKGLNSAKMIEFLIGLGLTGFGIVFSFLGVIFFFDKGLLAMGNILFVSGVSLTIGLKSTMQFFMKRSNFKGTISFGIGFFILLLGWPILGMIVESYGFI
ncbi:unnamed protein product, partial [Sphenostylis stenocarpa]